MESFPLCQSPNTSSLRFDESFLLKLGETFGDGLRVPVGIFGDIRRCIITVLQQINKDISVSASQHFVWFVNHSGSSLTYRFGYSR